MVPRVETQNYVLGSCARSIRKNHSPPCLHNNELWEGFCIGTRWRCLLFQNMQNFALLEHRDVVENNIPAHKSNTWKPNVVLSTGAIRRSKLVFTTNSARMYQAYQRIFPSSSKFWKCSRQNQYFRWFVSKWLGRCANHTEEFNVVDAFFCSPLIPMSKLNLKLRRFIRFSCQRGSKDSGSKLQM